MKRRLTIGENLAIGGIAALLGAILFPLFTHARSYSGPIPCVSSLRNLASLSSLYAADWDERFMLRDHWMDELAAYQGTDRPFRCSAVVRASKGDPQLYGIAFNSRLSEAQWPNPKEDRMELFYDSVNLARNASDPFVSLPRPARDHGRSTPYNVVVFTDMKAERLR